MEVINLAYIASDFKIKYYTWQACRGAQTDPGRKVYTGGCEDSSDAPMPPALYTIPIEADFLCVYSTVPGNDATIYKVTPKYLLHNTRYLIAPLHL